MGCYRCGSDQGDESRLCPDCTKVRQQEKRAHREMLRSRSDVAETDVVHGLSNNIWVRAALILHTITFFYVVLLFTGPLRGHGEIASFLFAIMTSCAIISFFIGTMFWIKMLMSDFMWALATFIFPGFIYRYVMINWDVKEVRVYAIFHWVLLGISLFALSLLSAHTGENPIFLWLTFTSYLPG